MPIRPWYRISGIQQYSSNESYNYGDYVYNGLTIYKCMEDILSPEPFDNNKWLARTYIEYLNDAQGIGNITAVLSTLTLPTQIEQELSQI